MPRSYARAMAVQLNHNAFLIDESDVDAIFERVQERGLQRATPIDALRRDG